MTLIPGGCGKFVSLISFPFPTWSAQKGPLSHVWLLESQCPFSFANYSKIHYNNMSTHIPFRGTVAAETKHIHAHYGFLSRFQISKINSMVFFTFVTCTQ
ncbi:hypothetical protein MtrunA17_Chr1g0176971 [Medicago truncatula]|uniref:Uncharacterized protein n=1 Tax=Medicago truncatula TaxID=3880 RepID=G7I7Z7_MEDTR|nr:hypothetical protein MTR_1g056200 [Medicago truncatula]RHN79402.1 hypothetical protein MtrunA17_Chr1g0176971 [Medicago truncatula]